MRVETKKIRKTFAKTVGVSPWQAQIGLFAFVLLSVMLISLSFVFKDFSAKMRSSAIELVTPVIEAVMMPVYAVRDGFDTVTDLTSLRSENAALLAENQKLTEWYYAAQSLKVENSTLQKALSYADQISYKYITTRVVADVSNEFAQSYIIPVGRDGGIHIGQAVLSRNIMIGRVVDVFEDSARVMLVNDINSRIPVLVEGEDIRAVLAGNNKDSADLVHLPPEIELRENMRIVTSGHGGILPPGLFLGETVKDPSTGRITVALGQKDNMIHMVQVVDFLGAKDAY